MCSSGHHTTKKKYIEKLVKIQRRVAKIGPIFRNNKLNKAQEKKKPKSSFQCIFKYIATLTKINVLPLTIPT